MPHTPYNLENIIKNSESSYLLAQMMDHGIAVTGFNWKQYEPSKFVYSFFAYNTVYDINWEKTYDSDELKYSNLNANEKIGQSLRFIYNNYRDDDANPIADDFVSLLLNSKMSAQHILTIHRDIVDDWNINQPDKSPLSRKNHTIRENFEYSLSRLQKEKFTLRDHYHLLIFCYQVRNNIFHGSKTIQQMSEENQKNRLLIYSEILLSTLEMFYKRIEKDCEYNRVSGETIRGRIAKLKF